MNDEKIFADGLIVKVDPNAPDWVLCKLSVKVSEFIAFLQQHESNDWVNLDAKIGQSGKPYAELNTWKPTQGDAAQAGIARARQAAAPAPAPAPDFIDDDVPFSNYQLRTLI